MQHIFCLVFLNKIVLGPFPEQILQIVSVLLHLHQQALQDQAHGVEADIKQHMNICRKYYIRDLFIKFVDCLSHC